MSGFLLRDPYVIGLHVINDPALQQDRARASVSRPREQSTASQFFRDTAFGHITRWFTDSRVFTYPYEHDEKELLRHLSSSTTVLRSELKHEIRSLGSNPDLLGQVEGLVDHKLLNWLPNDPDNPQNWSTVKKFFITFQICLLTTSVYIGSAIYVSGLEGIAERFRVSETVALLGLTTFMFAYGVGPMLLSPLQEIPIFGRSPIYVVTMLLFVGLQPAVIFAPNITILLIFRFITGLFGSPVLATGGASLVDIYSPQKRAYALTVWGVSNVMGPVLGPVIGGFAAEYEDWKWPLWELMWLSGFCLVLLFFFLPETSGRTILYHRARRIRRLRGSDAVPVKTADEVAAEGKRTSDMVYRAIVRPFSFLVTEPIVLALSLYVSLVYACLYLFFESFPLVFKAMYQFTSGDMGVAYVGLLIGVLLALPPYIYYMRYVLKPKFGPRGELRPEIRLQTACVACFFVPICLFWFGWSSGRTHWIVPIIGTVFFGPGAFLLFQAMLSYLADAYGHAHAASVFASVSILRCTFGATFPLFAGALYRRLGIDWGNTLLGFLTVAFIPIPFLLYKYGGKLRLLSKTARHDLID